MTTFIYSRVSTSAQDTALQVDDLRRWSLSQVGEIAWFEEKASGKKMDRPVFSSLLEQAATGDTIAVWRLDRLGRTAAGLTKLFADLQAKGINLVSLREGIDLNTAAGRLVANIIASVAQFELELRADRQRAGIAAARARGRKWGGSTKGRRSERIRLAEDTVRELASQGQSAYAIARQVNLPRTTVLRILKA